MNIGQISSRSVLMSVFSVLLALCLTTHTAAVLAVSIAEIEHDIRTFQQYFQQRFPDVALDEYVNGINALPQYADRRASWELLMALPPYEIEMELARHEWQEPFENGSSFEQCFTAHPPANEFPYFRNGQVLTIVGAINECLLAQTKETLKLDSAKLARLVSVFKAQSNGAVINIDYRDLGMRKIYETGRQYYWSRRGQNNFSCASCHVNNAGNRLRGDVLSAGLGQTSGFPVYRIKWSIPNDDNDNDNSTHPWGTIHRRYASCNIQAGAVPQEAQSPTYIALEVYQAIMNSGIPLKVPSLRQ